jgi:hypothetical protein
MLFSLKLLIISLFVISIKSNDEITNNVNAKSSFLRTESVYLSGMVTTCRGESITVKNAFVFDECQITSSTSSKKVILTDSITPIFTLTQYYDNQECNGIGDGGNVILSGTFNTTCPSGPYTYYSILYESDTLVISQEQQSNVNV